MVELRAKNKFRNSFSKSVSKHGSLITITIISMIVLAVYLSSSFDLCWFSVPGKSLDKGFVFSGSWTEHLHSSEEWAVFYQVEAFYHGRIWLSQSLPPNNTVDTCKIGNYYYALVEPATALFLLPFYTIGNSLFGESYLIRSALVGMFLFTILDALLIRKISKQLNQSSNVANAAALLFALGTMALSYSKLLYPQPIVAMLMLSTMYFLFRFRKTHETNSLVASFLLYGLTVVSFNAFIITAPLFLFYLLKDRKLLKREALLKGIFALIPSILIFVIWNSLVTGNPIITPRQIFHQSISFEILYTTGTGTWLNVEGLVGNLISPIGIFFVSPFLFASLLFFSSALREKKRELLFLASIIVEFWLFISFANLGGVAGRDFWVGGWANIARYMYIPTALIVIIATQSIEFILKRRSLLGAWLISVAVITSFLANLSYSIRHDTMVGLSKDIASTSLLVWPFQLDLAPLGILTFAAVLVSLLLPIYIFLRYRHTEFLIL